MLRGEHRRRSTILVAVLGVVLIAVAVALNVSWIVVNWRTGLLLVVGVVFFAILIGGLTLNTLFLIREIRRSEQHDAFTNAVTHELKTPVASLKLYLQTLRRRHLDREKEEEFVDLMLQDVDRLQNTIDQVLLAGKTRASRRLVHPRDVDITELVGDCVKIAGQRYHLVNGELQVVGAPLGKGPIVLGDFEELAAAVSNLIDNAVKYSGDQVKVAVEIVTLGARRVAIKVRDQGAGITRDELKRVFRRFYRIPGVPQARVKGSGLGLSIVFSVARRHGGRAYGHSDGVGKGSTFTLELPVKPA